MSRPIRPTRSPFLAPAALPRAFLLTLFVAMAATGCGDDGEAPPPTQPDPGGHEGTDEIVFSLLRVDDEGNEALAWKGTADGPLPDSPESTPVPSVGFRQAFRIAWEGDSEEAPIVGYRIRASEDPSAPFLPLDAEGNSVWGEATSFSFANEIPASAVVDLDCDTGPDCPDRRRFEPGVNSVRVLAINAEGRLLDAALGELSYEVNFAPRGRIVIEAGDDDTARPYWIARAADGGIVRRALAEGDSVPGGSRVVLDVRGRDRLFGPDEPDSACCDYRLDQSVPEIRVQARASFVQSEVDGPESVSNTLYGPVHPDSTLSMATGPFDYALVARVVDEHRAISPADTFRFVAGLPPQRPTALPAAGLGIEVLPPNQAPPEGDHGPLYAVIPGQTRAWDRAVQRWSQFPAGNSFTGALYHVPLTLQARPHPIVADLSPQGLAGDTDLARSFAYELIGELDPFNLRPNGRSDAIDFFLDTRTPGELILDGGDGFELFVPDLFWDRPDLFVPELVGEPCVFEEYCEIGVALRADLGRFLLRVRAKTTGLESEHRQLPPLPEGASGPDVIVDTTDFGRVSPVLEQEFALRLRITLPDAPSSQLWPAP